jgi:hypothetical protein
VNMTEWHEGYLEGLMGYRWRWSLLTEHPKWTSLAHKGHIEGWADRKAAHRDLGLEITGTTK